MYSGLYKLTLIRVKISTVYFWKRFNNDSPEYGLNFISDKMRNRIIDNFDSCVYGTVFID